MLEKATAEARRSNGTTATASRRPLTLATAGNKENLHPVTGLPLVTLTCVSKKRKGDALSTKLLVAKEAPPSPKKRKLSIAPSNDSTSAAVPKRMPLARRGSLLKGIRVRRPLELHPVEEEQVEEKDEDGEGEGEEDKDGEEKDSPTRVERASSPTPTRLTLEEIDARCYELTVLPLADISEAFDIGDSSDEESAKSEPASVCSHFLLNPCINAH